MNSRNMLPSVVKGAYLNNCSNNTLHTEISSSLFYSLSIVLFLQQSLWLLFIFVQVSMGHAHFPNVEMHISCKPDSGVFQLYNTRKVSQESQTPKSVAGFHTQFFESKKKPTFEPKLTGSGAYRGFVLPLFCACRQ